MNLPTVLVLIVVIVVLSLQAYATYKMFKTDESCQCCTNRNSCSVKNSIICTIEEKENK